MKFNNARKCIIPFVVTGILLPIFALSGCYDSGPGYGVTTGGMNSGSGSVKTFNATDLTDNSNYTVSANLVYNGTYCKVYKDSSDTYMTNSTAKAMGQEFDNKIYSKMISAFGAASDVDGDEKITLLVLDIKDGGSSTSYVAGYFDPVNEYTTTDAAQTIYSNECDMLYMDSNPGVNYPATFKQTMAHEFQHLIDFNQKVFIQGSTTGFDTWIDEGLSSAAEKIYSGSQVQDKVDYFNTDSYHDIVNGQRFIAWDKGTYNSVLGNYSTVYLFFQWLNIQSANDYSIYKVIMNSDSDNYLAVYSAKNYLTGFSGTSFSDMLRDWNIANLLCASSGLYGYKGAIATTVHYINDSSDNSSYVSGSTRDMMAGECIYTKITSSYTPASKTSITAAGVDTSSGVIDKTGTVYYGDVLLVYTTAATDSSTTYTTGSLPARVTSVSVLKSIRESSDQVTKRYPVDRVFKYNGMNFQK